MPTPRLPDQVDTIVVGAGTGGAAFTGVLAAHSDESILLLEAGPDYGAYADGGWPADVLNAKDIPLSHDYDLLGESHARPRRSTCRGPRSSAAAPPTTVAPHRSALARTTTTGPAGATPAGTRRPSSRCSNGSATGSGSAATEWTS